MNRKVLGPLLAMSISTSDGPVGNFGYTDTVTGAADASKYFAPLLVIAAGCCGCWCVSSCGLVAAASLDGVHPTIPVQAIIAKAPNRCFPVTRSEADDIPCAGSLRHMF